MKSYYIFLLFLFMGLSESYSFNAQAFANSTLYIKDKFLNGNNLIKCDENVTIQDSATGIFMKYLKSNWNDIHDVIMRFHCDNPYLKGIAEIEMEWVDGKIAHSSVKSNTTGDKKFGVSLIHAMKDWKIKGLPPKWDIVVPFKTQIYGSKNPSFKDCGIFTGQVLNPEGQPACKASVVLTPAHNNSSETDTLFTNREGIFIKTLLKPGKWNIECSDSSGAFVQNFQIEISASEHVKRFIKLK